MEPADEILYRCSFIDRKPIDQKALFPLLSKIDDWGGFLEKAFFHRVPLRLYSLLKRHGAASLLDSATWAKIESSYFKAQAFVMSHEAELHSLLPEFNRAGVDVLLLKGAALLQTVYRKKPLRFLVDLDLLVRQVDFSHAENLLQEEGYQQKPIRSHLPSAWHDRELGSQIRRGTSTWVHPERNVKIDLHEEAFEELSFFRFEPDWMWQKASPILINGHRAFLPSPANLFIHLLLHLVKHARMWENSLGWYLDLDECLRYFKKEINGKACLEILQKNQGAGKAFEILAFLDQNLGSPIPTELKSTLQKNDTPSLSRESIFFLPSTRSGLRSTHADWRDPAELFLFYWGQMRGWGKKFWFLWYWVFPDPSYLETKYPFGSLLEKIKAYLIHFASMTGKGVRLFPHLLRSQSACPNRKNGYTLLSRFFRARHGEKYPHS